MTFNNITFNDLKKSVVRTSEFILRNSYKINALVLKVLKNLYVFHETEENYKEIEVSSFL